MRGSACGDLHGGRRATDVPTVTTLSLDGYSTRIAAAEVEAREWVVATRTDGRALGIGERGPLWLVFDPPGERPVTEDESAMWPWAMFLIQCE